MEYLIVFLPLIAAFVSGFFGNVIGDRNSCIFNCLLISISAIFSLVIFYNVLINGYENKGNDFEVKSKSDEVILKEFKQLKIDVEDNVNHYRLDLAINNVYEFFWNKFCDVYIEECKKTEKTDNLHPLLKEILIFIHPFAPFITEEIHSIIFKAPLIDR